MHDDAFLPRLITCCLAALLVLSVVGCRTEGGAVLLEDRFANPQSGWGTESQAAYDRGYQDGEYFIEVYEPNWLTWTRADERFDDTIVEAEARWVSGARDGHYGILCRYRSPGDFYYFAITADGLYAIMRVENGVPSVLSGEGFRPSPAVRTGGEANELRATCRGEDLSLSVNGEELAAVVDTAFLKGDIALAVGSGPEGEIRIHFDNLLVTTPGEAAEEGE
jgi:hypothetical protein